MTAGSDTLKKLETFLHKATNSESDDDIDITALDGFCTTIQFEPHIAISATKLLAGKIKSSNTNEALCSLAVLDECMKSCGQEFQTEVGKFRFLNELCYLVSTKYKGNSTPKIIKDKILDLLLIWTVHYPHLTKVKEIYDMLRTQGVIHEPTKNVIIENRKSASHTITSSSKTPDDETTIRLKKLAQSKNPLDVQAANVLIQNMVKETDRKEQLKSSRLLELQRVKETVSVLNEMLDQFDSEKTSESELTTINELYTVCQNLHPTVIRLAQETQENEESLGDILEASNQITDVFAKYKHTVTESKSSNEMNSITLRNENQNSSSTSTLPLLDISTSSVNHIDNLLESDTNTQTVSEETNNVNVMSDLSDIFSTVNNDNVINKSDDVTLMPELIKPSRSVNGSEESNIYSILNCFNSPQPIVNTKMVKPLIDKNRSLEKPSPTKLITTNKNIPDLDTLVTGMIQHSLNQPKLEVAEKSDDTNEDDKSIITEYHDTNQNDEFNDDLIEQIINLTIKMPEIKEPTKTNKTEFQTLANIQIDLEQIKPSNEPPRVILNETNGLKVVLNFADDHPRPDVSVIVVTVINQGSKPISSFQFNASISKLCKLRLLPASSNCLAGVKPFRPPTDDITQVLLYSNPENIKNANLVCILSYCVGDDPDPINESIEVKNLPIL